MEKKKHRLIISLKNKGPSMQSHSSHSLFNLRNTLNSFRSVPKGYRKTKEYREIINQRSHIRVKEKTKKETCTTRLGKNGWTRSPEREKMSPAIISRPTTRICEAAAQTKLPVQELKGFGLEVNSTCTTLQPPKIKTEIRWNLHI